MKPLSLLFLTGLCSVTFSGCYMDRQPTMTLEERAMASDKEIADYEAQKAAEGSKKTAPVEVKSTASNPTGEIDSQIPTADRQFVGFSGRKFMAGIVRASDGRNASTLEIWGQSAAGAWRKIASAEFDGVGVLVPALHEKAGLVVVYGNKNGAEIFRYDLSMASR